MSSVPRDGLGREYTVPTRSGVDEAEEKRTSSTNREVLEKRWSGLDASDDEDEEASASLGMSGIGTALFADRRGAFRTFPAFDVFRGGIFA